MPGYRLRAVLHFRAGNGMATWARDQNVVRLGQAYHLNPGTYAEERSRHSVAADVYTCDLIYPTQALAVDTWNTLIAVCVDGYLKPPTGRAVSWMDLHTCQHGPTPTPCVAPSQSWTNQGA